MLQAIQSWVTLQPLGSAGATDPCLVTTVPGDRTTAISGPEVGIGRAFTNFNCRYFEIYQDDLLHAGFVDEFQTWHEKLHGNVPEVPIVAVEGVDIVLSWRSTPGEFFDVQHRPTNHELGKSGRRSPAGRPPVISGRRT